MADLVLEFAGPYSWPGLPDAPSVFSAPEARSPGIYLWTVSTPEGSLVYYVGETGRSFAARMTEHYEEHCSGFYHLYEPVQFASGVKSVVWPGLYDRDNRRSLVECVRSFLELTPTIAALTNTYRFFLASLQADSRLRRRAEAAIAYALGNSSGEVGAFQVAGIRYDRRLEHETPVSCAIKSNGIRGLPGFLLV